MDSIAKIVKTAEDNFISGNTQTGKYVQFSLHETIEKIYAYLNSKHISGETDAMGREKPFFNIVTSAVNIWYRATDIDRKNVRIKPTKQSNSMTAMLADIKLIDWMRKTQFGVFLNQWGRNLVEYGSSVIKFVEKDGVLYPSVVPWNRLIIDSVNFENAPVIEKLYLTPAQLRKNKNYDQETVKSLLQEKVARKNLDGSNKDNSNDFIEVYEVHGELPLSYLTGREEDEDTFVQQMHVISYLVNTEKKGEVDEFSLVKGREDKSPYMITHLIQEDGRVIGKGAVELLFESQWMMNHTVKSIKDQLDIASKILFQSADPTLQGRNALINMEQGDLIIHAPNMPVGQVNNNSHDIGSLQSYGNQWKALSQEITSTPDAISGNNFPSGTAYRQVALLNQEAHSLFELMVENKGLCIEDMLRQFVIPHIKKTLNTTDEIVAVLDSHAITKIDNAYLPGKAAKIVNEINKKKILSGEIITTPTDIQVDETKRELQQGLAAQGNERFFSPEDVPGQTWKEVFKDLEWEVEVEVTNENSDKQTALATLSTVLQTVASNPAIMQEPTAKFIFNKILEESGTVSPIELGQLQTQKPTQAPNINQQGQSVAG